MKNPTFGSFVGLSTTNAFASAGKFAFVLVLHAALVVWVLNAQLGTPSESTPIRMNVLTIELPAPRQQEIPKPVVQQPKPKPKAPARPAPRPAAPAAPQPVTTTAPAAAQAPPSSAVAPQPAMPAKEETPSPPAPVAVTAARFDADYLQNPAPVFPALSRKLQEEGKVLLLVQVSAKGEPENVQIKQSSGFRRLDEAAMNAVRKWRFVPARRGDEPVASSVVVPLLFRLDN